MKNNKKQSAVSGTVSLAVSSGVKAGHFVPVEPQPVPLGVHPIEPQPVPL
jgi:hypothetical protein